MAIGLQKIHVLGRGLTFDLTHTDSLLLMWCCRGQDYSVVQTTVSGSFRWRGKDRAVDQQQAAGAWVVVQHRPCRSGHDCAQKKQVPLPPHAPSRVLRPASHVHTPSGKRRWTTAERATERWAARGRQRLPARSLRSANGSEAKSRVQLAARPEGPRTSPAPPSARPLVQTPVQSRWPHYRPIAAGNQRRKASLPSSGTSVVGAGGASLPH